MVREAPLLQIEAGSPTGNWGSLVAKAKAVELGVSAAAGHQGNELFEYLGGTWLAGDIHVLQVSSRLAVMFKPVGWSVHVDIDVNMGEPGPRILVPFLRSIIRLSSWPLLHQASDLAFPTRLDAPSDGLVVAACGFGAGVLLKGQMLVYMMDRVYCGGLSN